MKNNLFFTGSTGVRRRLLKSLFALMALGMFSFTDAFTQCSGLSVPSSEDFETFSTTFGFTNENCWTGTGPGANDIDIVDASSLDMGTPTSGTQAVELNDGQFDSNDTSAFVTPYLNGLSAGDKRIRFQVSAEDVSCELYLGVMSDSSDLSTLTIIDTVLFSQFDTWKEHVLDLTNTAVLGSANYFAFVHGPTSFEIGIDDFNFELVPSCPAPSSIALNDVSAAGATLSWNFSGPGANFEYVNVLQGNTPPATGTPITADSAVIGSLSATTQYDFYVREACGSNDTSSWAGPFTYTTLCNPVTSLPWTEDFESVTTPAVPSCFTVNDNNNDGDFWETQGSSTYANSGSNSLEIYTDFNSGANDDYLILPGFTLTGNERLVYNYRARSDGEPNDFMILASTTGNQPADFTDTLLLDTADSETFTQQIVDLSAYNSNVFISFYVPQGSLDGWYLYVDDLTVESIPACQAPTGVAFNNVSATGSTLSWSFGGPGNDFTYLNIPQGNTPSGAGTLVSADSVNLGSLSPNTSYDFYVREVCGTNDTSAWTGPFTYSTPCLSASLPYLEDFESGFPSCWTRNDTSEVLIDSNFQTNSTSFLRLNGLSTPGGIATSQNIDVSGQPSVWVKFDISEGANNDPEPPADNLTVEYFDGTQYQTVAVYDASISTWQTDSFLISSGLTNQFNVRFTSIGTGSNFDDWDIDNVEVYTGPSCVPPSSIAVSNITSTGATVNWTPNGSGTNFDYQVVLSGNTPSPSGTGVNADSVILGGLTPGTIYDFYVREICGANDTSIWNGPVSFTTLCPPGGFTTPYSQGFDGVPTADPFAGVSCWSIAGNEANEVELEDGAFWISALPSSPNNVEFGDVDLDSGDTAILVSPQFSDLPDADNRIRFEAAFEDASSNTSELIIGVMSDPNDPSTFVELQRVTSNTDDVFNSYTVNLDNAASIGTAQYIAIASGADDGGFDEIAFDDFVYEEIPTCFLPQNVSNYQLTSDSASFTWTAQGAGTSFAYLNLPSGTSPGGQGNVISNDSVVLSGLTPNTSYDFYVREICGANDSSSWAGPFTYTTNCTPFTAPYSQNFDGAPAVDPFAGISCWSTAGPGANDIELNDSPDPGIDPAPSAPNSVEMNDGDLSGGDTSALVTPAFSDLSTGLNRIRFKAAFENTAATLYIGVISDITDPTTFTLIDSITTGTEDVYEEYIVQLDNQALIGSAENIVFVHGSSAFEIYIDDFFYEANPCIGYSVDLGNDTSYCAGEVFNTTLDAGNAGSTYNWSDNSTNQTLAVDTAGTYWVEVSDTVNGCFAVDTLEVTENALPMVDLGNDTAYCAGDAFNITLDAGNAGSTYNWSDNSTNQTLAVDTAGTYWVEVTNANGCVSTDTLEVTENALPMVDLGNDTAYCAGDAFSITLDAGNAGAIYNWSDNSTNQTLAVDTAGTYWVEVTNAGGCVSTDTLEVTENALPMVDLGNDTAYCAGDAFSITLDAGNAGASYNWSDNSTGQTLTVNTAGTYWVEVTNANGCVSTDTLEVTESSAPTVSLNDAEICADETATLDAGAGFASYNWSTGETTQTITVSTDDTYDVTVTNAAGCEGEASAVVTVNPLPVVDLGNDTSMSPGYTITLDAGSDGDTYNWNTGASTQTVDVEYGDVPAEFSVEVTSAEGCVSTDTIFIDANTGVRDLVQGSIKLYPNPTRGNAKLDMTLTEGGEMMIEVYSTSGQLLDQVQYGASAGQQIVPVDMSNYENGMYIINVKLNDESISQFNVTKM